MNDLDAGLKLPVIEEFYTIQGEGYNAGEAAYFIRVGGCDIGCKWCDTKFSWKADLFKLTDVNCLVERVSNSAAKSIVVTGGEPLNYNLDYLCSSMKKEGIRTFIETSGAYPFTGVWDWVCLSPKKQSPPLPEAYRLADEIKVIVFDFEDIQRAEQECEKVSLNCKLYLQPEWSKREEINPVLVEFIKNNPKWKLSLQIHKYIKIP